MPCIIVIGASAGGVWPLIELVSALPADLDAAIFIVQHFPTGTRSALCDILNRNGALRSAPPFDGQEILSRRIYVAPPNDHHMVIGHSRVRLVASEKEHSFRPAIDSLFRSAAAAYGSNAIGILLSGLEGDGVAGLQSIQAAGGISIVQDPREARFPGLPMAARTAMKVDYCLPIKAIAALLLFLAVQQRGEREVLQGAAGHFALQSP